MGNVTGAVALRQEEQKKKAGQLSRFLASLTPEVQRALPRGLDADRITRLALTAARKNPDLLDCTPESFAGALLTASACGLEPDVGGEAYLVPYGAECQLIIGYQGMAKLFWQHPLASILDAQAVHERDAFDYAYGTAPFLAHKPAIGDRGPIVCYYAVMGLSTGATRFLVMSPEEIKAQRGGKVGPSAKFKAGDPSHWMERKTVLRQLFKLGPKSYTLALATTADERDGSELYRDRLTEAQNGIPAAVTVHAAEAAPERPADVDADGVITGELVPDDYDPTTDPDWPSA